MSAAQVTEAHIARARASGYTTDKGVQMAAQFVANNEAAKAERDQLRAECNNLRADLDAIKAIRDEEKARAERAEAEVERLRHLEALLNQAAAEVTAHTFTAGGIAGLRAELALLREWQREVIQNANAHHAERKQAIARAERAEAELAGIRALANRRNKRDHSQDTTHQLVAALDQALDIAQAELAAERARLCKVAIAACKEAQIKPVVWYPKGSSIDPNDLGKINQQQVDACVAAIDAAMKEEIK